jgi:PAS domain S-box-containing protein
MTKRSDSKELTDLSRAINSSRNGILVMDLEGRIVAVSVPVVEKHGFTSRKEIIGKGGFDLISPADRERVLKILEKLREKGYIDGVKYHILTKDGHKIPVEADGVVLKNGHGKSVGIVVFVRDITEQEREKETFRRILDNLIEHVIYEDTDMRIIWANKAACDSVERSREELIGRYCYEIWPKRTDRCPDCPVVKAIKSGNPHKIEKTTPDGRSWFIRGYPMRDRHEKIIGGIEVTLDITERKKSEKALKESEKKYRQLVKYAPTGIIETNLERNRFVDVNNVICEYTGYTREELLSMDPLSLFPEEDKKRYLERVRKAVAGEELSESVEYTIERKDGRELFVVVTPRITADKKGTPISEAIVHDITERKKAEKALQDQKKELSAFAHTVAHDLKNHIGIIRNRAQFSLKKEETIQHNAEEIIGITKKMEKFVNRQLQLADAGKTIGEPHKVDLNKLIDHVKKSHEIAVRREDLSAIYGDPERLEEVFHNLFDNALKHGDATEIKITSEKGDDTVRIYVKDNGRGIPAGKIDKIFDVGYSKTHTGFGLAIVKKIIEAHGGSIRECSGEGKGAIFVIEIPIII